MTTRGDEPKRLAYRLADVSNMTGIPVRTLRDEIKKGKLRAARASWKLWLVFDEDLRVYVDALRARGGRLESAKEVTL